MRFSCGKRAAEMMSRKAKHLPLCSLLLFLIHLNPIEGMVANGTLLKMQPKSDYRHSRYTIDDLLYAKFSYKVSDDIDMDPCKSGKSTIIEWNRRG